MVSPLDPSREGRQQVNDPADRMPSTWVGRAFRALTAWLSAGFYATVDKVKDLANHFFSKKASFPCPDNVVVTGAFNNFLRETRFNLDTQRIKDFQEDLGVSRVDFSVLDKEHQRILRGFFNKTKNGSPDFARELNKLFPGLKKAAELRPR